MLRGGRHLHNNIRAASFSSFADWWERADVQHQQVRVPAQPQEALMNLVLSVLNSWHIPAMPPGPGCGGGCVRTGFRHKFSMGPPLQTHLCSDHPHLLCPSWMFAPTGTFGALSWCSSCVLFPAPSLQGIGCKLASPNPRSCQKGALCQVHTPSSPHGQ